MTRSDAKQECKGWMVASVGDLEVPQCKSCLSKGLAFNRHSMGCADCVLIFEEWSKLTERLQSILRKEMAGYQVRKSETA